MQKSRLDFEKNYRDEPQKFENPRFTSMQKKG